MSMTAPQKEVEAAEVVPEEAAVEEDLEALEVVGVDHVVEEEDVEVHEAMDAVGAVNLLVLDVQKY